MLPTYINLQFLISKVTLIGISVRVDSNSKTKNLVGTKVWLEKNRQHLGEPQHIKESCIQKN